MSFETWCFFLLVAIVPVLSPGPAIFLTIKNALKFGSRPTVFSAIGNSLGLVLLGFAVAFGIGAALNAAGWIGTAIQIVGGSYLVYLGIKVWRDKSIGRFDTQDGLPPTSPLARLGEGFFISVTNPKSMALLAAIFPPFLDSGNAMTESATILSLTYSAMCLVNHLLLIVFARKLKFIFENARSLAVVRATLSTCFVGAGAALTLG